MANRELIIRFVPFLFRLLYNCALINFSCCIIVRPLSENKFLVLFGY